MTGRELYDKLQAASMDEALTLGINLELVAYEHNIMSPAWERVAKELFGQGFSDDTLANMGWDEQQNLYERLFTIGHRIR